jgi:periplasmic copper chaperone A
MQGMQRIFRRASAALLLVLAPAVHAEGRLGVYDAWMRASPDDASSMSGYATLRNDGDARVSVLTVQSDAFRQASILDTVVERGRTRARELPRIDLAPGATIQLKPGGPHLTLTDPRHSVEKGDKVRIVFLMASGQRVETYFDVVAPDTGADEN